MRKHIQQHINSFCDSFPIGPGVDVTIGPTCLLVHGWIKHFPQCNLQQEAKLGTTALHMAVALYGDNIETVNVLLAAVE